MQQRNRFFASMMLSTLLLTALPAAKGDSANPLNRRVLQYCNENLGKRVGNGQCAGLAAQALRHAGARPRAAKGYPAWNDYVWGKQVCLIEGSTDGTRVTSGSLDDVQPGDIAQFSQVRFIAMHAAHHTAVVDYITPKRLGLISQNGGGDRGVISKGSVRVDKLSQGWIRFYQPLPR
jgi:hypothetical protein